MTAGYSDLYLEQGATFTTQLTLTDTIGLAYNLSSFTVESKAKRSYYSSNAAIIFDTSIIDANGGIIQISANNYVTTNVKPGRLLYDVKITDTVSNNVTRVIEGIIYVNPAVT
jgi:hypothetical protein